MVHHQKNFFFVKILIIVLEYFIKLSLVNLIEKCACGGQRRGNIAKIEIGAIPPPLNTVLYSPQWPTAAILYSNSHGGPCTLTCALHGA